MYATSQVSFLEAFKRFWLNYVNFQGRARRSEFWWVVLWHTIILLPVYFSNSYVYAISIELWDLIRMITLLYLTVTFIPNLALTTRRLHDNGFSMLAPIINIVAWIVSFLSFMYAIFTIFDPYASDTGHSIENSAFFWSFIMLIVALGLHIFVLVISIMDSKKGSNKYGPSPKYVQQEAPYIDPKQGDITDNANLTEPAQESIDTTDDKSSQKDHHNTDHKNM
ncbi:DUF805 domain-containing protein [Staphylococcus agnetis]|uniref:DUF805 domain-containing protein n=1 Tax=Staphylococcus agnetis TaxID=985762 RepID=UPI00208E5AEE|nr:DUF805 domain-containing protein [Staphylococcus agnetis]MCO4340370.1 DUF805 domain-containing protein [Staphylococcus agnetis]MCO4342920.1 DUF805 domain-containing protein [Staphylococcus agnetis]MCO4345015.1 DUF805 domain-containing protein [Staphylococcus agnetis]MCO4347331.1 DUF805 domain-containing protein [Staphylococcus agnetis]MCO4353871.1 DUF805 domain-containing protein [Staphylococcus agnetis]